MPLDRYDFLSSLFLLKSLPQVGHRPLKLIEWLVRSSECVLCVSLCFCLWQLDSWIVVVIAGRAFAFVYVKYLQLTWLLPLPLLPLSRVTWHKVDSFDYCWNRKGNCRVAVKSCSQLRVCVSLGQMDCRGPKSRVHRSWSKLDFGFGCSRSLFWGPVSGPNPPQLRDRFFASKAS